MPDIAVSDLLRVLETDAIMRDWISDQLDLPPGPTKAVTPPPWVADFPSDHPWLSLAIGTGRDATMVHLVVAPPGTLTDDTGRVALRRAVILNELTHPVSHKKMRVALLTPQEVLSANGAGAYGFRYGIAAEDLGLLLRKVLAA